MTTSIFHTRISIPPHHNDILLRPRIFKKLEQGLAGKLTLVSAPAGFGKTTLVSSFLHKQSRVPVAWLSLEKNDDGISQFLLYLSASLTTIAPELGQSTRTLLSIKQIPSISTIIKSLINEIADIHPDHLALVLDDYHNIKSPEVHDAISLFIEHIPAHIHLIVISREDPPFPLARLRVNHQLTEIRASDLRFSQDETTAFLRQSMGVLLSEDEIVPLQKRTEGWIAGLQMAAISLHGRADRKNFLSDFSSSDRFIFDYLIEEVLEQQSPHIQDFLLRTSILNRMSASLCDAVREENDSQEILSQLEQANLFLIPLDEKANWHQYHHLFSDLLRQQLKLRYKERVIALHHRAIQWYQENQLIGDAIQHALEIGSHEKIAELVEQLFFEGIEQIHLRPTANWLNKLPDEFIASKPWLNVVHARILIKAREIKQAKDKLQEAQDALANYPLHADKERQLKSYIVALQAHSAMLEGQIDKVIPLAHQAMELLPPWETRLRGTIFSILGTSLQRIGKFDEAIEALEEGVSYSKATNDPESAIETLGDLAGFFVERGNLYRAFSICQDADGVIEGSFTKTGRYPFTAGYIHFRLSTILRHWNDLDGSLFHAEKSIELNRRWGYENRLSLINLAIASQAKGDQKGAFQAIQQAEIVAAKESFFWVEDVYSVRALLHLGQGNLDAALKWAKESNLSDDDEIPFEKQRTYLILAQIYIAQGQQGDNHALSKAIHLLERLEILFDPASAKAYSLQVFILQVLAYRAQNLTEQTMAALEQALYIGEQGGFVRVFVREGEPMRKILEEAAKRNLYQIYIQELLSAFNVAPENTVAISELKHDRLTAREQEILELLDTDLTIPEIAAQLVISVSTARTHIKRIYNKLDVHSRFEAVTKAKQKN